MSKDKKVYNRILSCPRDQSTLEEFTQQGVFLDECKDCGGVFFDQGEMFGALGMAADPSLWDRAETGGLMDHGHLKCCRCNNEMLVQDVKYGDEHVEIDRCGECGGIWLDKGESDKIMTIGEKITPIVHAERDKAQVELAKMGDVDFRSGSMIHGFLSIFRGRKK